MIPSKSNFKFQELTPITGVKPYVIRFWETEFPEIAPLAGDSGHKIYARKDVEAILKIRKLLFEEKLSISEAKLRMQKGEVELDLQNTAPEIVGESETKKLILSALDLIQEIKFKRNW